jgi:hypothetical protein
MNICTVYCIIYASHFDKRTDVNLLVRNYTGYVYILMYTSRVSCLVEINLEPTDLFDMLSDRNIPLFWTNCPVENVPSVART